MIENFKKIVTDKLTEAGLLANDDESIFSSAKIIQEEKEDSLMLVGPNREAWVFVGSMMQTKDFNDNLEGFVNIVKNSTIDKVKKRIDINPNIPLKTYLEGLAKLFGTEAPTTKLGTTTLKELVDQIIPKAKEPKEDK